MPFSLEFMLFRLVLDHFAGDAFVAGDIDQIDAGRKGTDKKCGHYLANSATMFCSKSFGSATGAKR